MRTPAHRQDQFHRQPQAGREIQRTAGVLFKRVALELGGKSPQIVFDDASFDDAVRGCALGLFANQGQVCAAGSRILVQRSLAERFGAALAEAAQAVNVGDPHQPGVQMGPVAKKAQFERVNRYIQLGIDQGATLLAGGVSTPGRGWFVRPTIFANARNDMAIARDEIFGPVGTLITFDTEDEAVALANDSSYGLAGDRVDHRPGARTPRRRGGKGRCRGYQLLEPAGRQPAVGWPEDQWYRARRRLQWRAGLHRGESHHRADAFLSSFPRTERAALALGWRAPRRPLADRWRNRDELKQPNDNRSLSDVPAPAALGARSDHHRPALGGLAHDRHE